MAGRRLSIGGPTAAVSDPAAPEVSEVGLGGSARPAARPAGISPAILVGAATSVVARRARPRPGPKSAASPAVGAASTPAGVALAAAAPGPVSDAPGAIRDAPDHDGVGMVVLVPVAPAVPRPVPASADARGRRRPMTRRRPERREATT